ncbi:hypothetical protein AURDEDRAFT_163268 [Auricularia subglabra TFB-10046 SS5]|nr:hypothetical protein AURDEDRAFT_163268 [Auricularia subglabra TFB-10046 SS5]
MLLAITVAFICALGLPVVSGADSEAYATGTCTCDYPLITLYRAYSYSIKDNFYTTDHDELDTAIHVGKYTRQPDAGRVLANDSTIDGAIPLYRLWNPRVLDHFYTISKVERDNVAGNGGWVYEGVVAKVLAGPACGTLPLYRTFQGSNYDHFYTTNASDEANAITKLGYVFESVAGYIWPGDPFDV